ncbi:DUF1403 family protein [Profundibacter sp.]
MKKAARPTENHPKYLPPLPSWVILNLSKTPETEAFVSGASLMMLHMVLADPADILPAGLLRNRLALRASAACLKLEGRNESEADIRDACYLTKAGDETGPAGDMFARWRKVSAIGLKQRDWPVCLKVCMTEHVAEQLPEWIDMAMAQRAGQGASPVVQAAKMVDLVMNAFPREEASALMCGDAVLAQALGWTHPVPLLGLHLKGNDLRDVTVEVCHNAVARGAQDAVRLSHDLLRRAERLRAVAPKLRAKGSDAAVALFLREDAVLPGAMLSPKIKGTNILMTDRAARRLCDRLVDLGVVRELTGRSTFRLYGVA